MESIDTILDRLAAGQKTRFVAFGSSNTDRRIHGLHWFDWLDLGLKQTYGRVHHCINAGLGGDTTQDLLMRFDEDVALYQPHVVFITIGGNDANPESNISAAVYHANLHRLISKIRDLDAIPILQTYYAGDIPNLGEPHGSRFLQFMDIVRITADETHSLMIDHHKRWEPLRTSQPDQYQSLMIDALHVNSLGNMVLGLDLIRTFKARLEQAQLDFCAEGIRYQKYLDQLAGVVIMIDTNNPKAGDLALGETVPAGFECVYTGDRDISSVDTSDTDLVFGADDTGFVTMQYSLWGFAHTTEDKWNDEIRAINRMQAAFGPLSENTRRIRAHIASLVPCDNGVPVTIDEILNAIGTGNLPQPAFHPGCWLSSGTRTTQPSQVQSMCDMENILMAYIDGEPAVELVERYPYASGFIERSYAWLGPRQHLTKVQKLLVDRMLLPFEFFTKHNPDRHAVYVDCFKPGGQGEAMDTEISTLVGIPKIYPNYTREYKEHLDTIQDVQKKTLYMIAGHIANGVSELSDCHHNTFRFIERWIHAIGTLTWDIPTRKPHAEATRLGRLLFGYALGLDRWLQAVPQQFVLQDIGHIDLGFDPKNEILRVYAYLGEDHTSVKEWLVACLWYTLVLMPPASLYKWGHRHKDLLQRASDAGISVRTWMDDMLAAK